MATPKRGPGRVAAVKVGPVRRNKQSALAKSRGAAQSARRGGGLNPGKFAGEVAGNLGRGISQVQRAAQIVPPNAGIKAAAKGFAPGAGLLSPSKKRNP